ncbi:MAG: group III truncated hemoglobin [Oceanicaulis sp.]
MPTVIRTASARRSEMRAEADALGVDEAFIDQLVEAFYEKVRADAALGPVFAHAIGEDWAPHLATMKCFWSSIALGTGVYSGRPLPAHHKHVDRMAPEHFDRWLSLFRQTLEEMSESPAAVAFFMERAERIGERFRTLLWQNPYA